MGFKKFVKKHATVKNAKKAYKFARKHENTARKALNLAMKIKDAVNIEYKVKDKVVSLTDLADGSIGANGAESTVFHLLSDISQGTADGERIGDSLKLQRLTGRGTISWKTQPSTATARLIRVIIMRGKHEKRETQYTVDGTDAILEHAGVLGSKHENTKYNNKFLHDKVYTLDTAKKNIITFKWSYPLNWHINYAAGGTNVEDGGLYIAVLTNDAVTGAGLCKFYADFNISYTDN